MAERWSSRHCLVDCAKDSRWVLPVRWRMELWWLNSRLWCVLTWLMLALFWFAAVMKDMSPLLPWWSQIWFDVQRWSSRRRCSGNDGGDVASSMVVVAAWRSMASVLRIFLFFLKKYWIYDFGLSAIEAEKRSMASGNDRGQKGVPFGLALICLGS